MPARAAACRRVQIHVAGLADLRPGYAQPAVSQTGHLIVSLTGHQWCRATHEVHAILNANLIGCCPVTDLFTSTGRKWLAEQVLPTADREAIEREFREIERVSQDPQTLDRGLAVEAIDDPRLQRAGVHCR